MTEIYFLNHGPSVPEFSPPQGLTFAFAALTLVVVALDVFFVRLAAPAEKRTRWTLAACGVAGAWLLAHGFIAKSGVLFQPNRPQVMGIYLGGNIIVAVLVARSSLGARLSSLPLAALVLLQAFRLPLEVLLHLLHEAGELPVQMTWSGRNLDVITGLSASAVGLVGLWRGVPARVALAFNLLGFGLLINVVVIAVLSAPLPFRQFMNDPPVVLVFHAPYNWIVNVHVWTAMVGHLLIFRALLAHRP